MIRAIIEKPLPFAEHVSLCDERYKTVCKEKRDLNPL